jgi:hypothetical protein
MKMTMNGMTFECTMDEAKQLVAVAAATNTVPTATAVTTHAASRTLAAAKAASWTERIHRAVMKTSTVINNTAGVAGNWSADKVSTIEVKTAPAVVSATGYMAVRSATTLAAAGTTMSSFAERCAALCVAMEFAK